MKRRIIVEIDTPDDRTCSGCVHLKYLQSAKIFHCNAFGVFLEPLGDSLERIPKCIESEISKG